MSSQVKYEVHERYKVDSVPKKKEKKPPEVEPSGEYTDLGQFKPTAPEQRVPIEHDAATTPERRLPIDEDKDGTDKSAKKIDAADLLKKYSKGGPTKKSKHIFIEKSNANNFQNDNEEEQFIY